MTNAIAVLYDLSTEENRSYSMNIISALASRGIAFDISAGEGGRVCLIVDGSTYAPGFIEANQDAVLKHAERTDKMMRKKGLELAASAV